MLLEFVSSKKTLPISIRKIFEAVAWQRYYNGEERAAPTCGHYVNSGGRQAGMRIILYLGAEELGKGILHDHISQHDYVPLHSRFSLQNFDLL